MWSTLTSLALISATALAAPHEKQGGWKHDKLNHLAVRAGKHWFGTAADIPGTAEASDAAYLKILKEDFGEVTPANSMKFMYTEPEQNVFNFTQGDEFVQVAKKNHQQIRCHNLVWVSELSEFVTSTNWTRDALIGVMRNHIFKTVQHFGTDCYSWDVVNEALNGDGTFSSSVWYDTIGEDYFYLAFQYAQEALEEIHAEEVKLYYNDYGIENPGPKVDAVLKLVEELRCRDIRIDGIGLESHFIVGETPTLDQQVAAKKSYIDADLDVAITELDVRFSQAPYYTEAGQKQQAADYYASVASCMEVGERCIGIVVWDFDDAYSWVPSAFAGQGGADIFNATLEAKPAYFAVADALKGVPCSVC